MEQINYNGSEYTTYDFEYIKKSFEMMAENYQKTVPTLQPTTPSSVPNSDNDFINPPFPPSIDPEVLARELFNNRRKRSKKMQNEFFLFRKEFVRELKRQNLRLKQTKVSALASRSWHKQDPKVKDEYRRLARETERIFNERQKQRDAEASRTCSNESDGSPTLPTVSEVSLQINHGSVLESQGILLPFIQFNQGIRQPSFTTPRQLTTGYHPYYQFSPSQYPQDYFTILR